MMHNDDRFLATIKLLVFLIFFLICSSCLRL